jgi:dihydroorotate dehydrogenase (NAD+) catalytic subunit
VRIVLATEDGSRGVHGRITVPLEAALRARPLGSPVKLYVCGPTPMMRACAQLAAAHGRACDVSLEQVMGCGLLQLRRPRPRPERRRTASHAHVHRRPGLRRTADRVGGRPGTLMDLSVRIGSLTLPNPLIAASGCFGYGVEYADVVDLSSLGGVAVKGLFLSEREGHAPPRIVETPSGMLNAIGLQGIGVHRFIRERLPELRERRAIVIVNICGTTLDEYVEVARILSDAEGVHALELNISCPNIKEGGITFGCSLPGTHAVVGAVRKATRLPVIPKLTPNVTDVASFARAAEEAGADAVSLVNTFLAMAIDVHTRRPRLTNIVGGLSGPAIRPIAVRMVYECRRVVKIPIVGMGGIATAEDVLECMIAGANAVQVGTMNFVDPFIWGKLLDGIREYMARHGIARLQEIVGTVDTSTREKAWISS